MRSKLSAIGRHAHICVLIKGYAGLHVRWSNGHVNVYSSSINWCAYRILLQRGSRLFSPMLEVVHNVLQLVDEAAIKQS